MQACYAQGDRSEASRVIFMGWPGQHELDDDPGGLSDPSSALSVLTGLSETEATSSRAGKSAQPPLALAEDAVRAQNGRQLGCARHLASAPAPLSVRVFRP